MKYFIYTRKSTDSEERQILSIEAQLAELQEFAAKPACRPGREKLEIVKECGEAAAATCLPRPSAAGEAENSFELYSIYTAFASSKLYFAERRRASLLNSARLRRDAVRKNMWRLNFRRKFITFRQRIRRFN